MTDEPVAWRCRCGWQNLWSYGTEEECDWYIKQAGSTHFEKQPLYTNKHCEDQVKGEVML
jgi:hypothetical protein